MKTKLAKAAFGSGRLPKDGIVIGPVEVFEPIVTLLAHGIDEDEDDESMSIDEPIDEEMQNSDGGTFSNSFNEQ